MLVVVNCEDSRNKPHAEAYRQVIGKGHTEWFLDTGGYKKARSFIRDRDCQVTYDAYLKTFRVHFFDNGVHCEVDDGMATRLMALREGSVTVHGVFTGMGTSISTSHGFSITGVLEGGGEWWRVTEGMTSIRFHLTDVGHIHGLDISLH